MKIRFYIDPVCPWCWITSRWMTEVSTERNLEIEFCSFSLAIKNDLMDESKTEGYGPVARATHSFLRVIEKIKQDEGDNANEIVARFYSSIGKRIHIQGDKEFNFLNDVLSEIGLDLSYADASTDTSLDKAITDSMDLVMETVGNDVGVPILILETPEGDRGFFGPVISELPSKEDSLKLYDGIASMISLGAFYELKRTREVGPDIQTTARLFAQANADNEIADGDACPIG